MGSMSFGWRSFDVTAHLVPMGRYARALTRHAEDAEDLVHTALLRAYERRATFRRGENLRTWLFAILHNSFIDGWRRRNAENARIAAVGSLATPHAEPGQDHALHLREIFEAYLALPEPQRAAFHLVALEGLSYAEAAEILDVPAGTVMSRLSRAREMLRQMDAGEAPPARHPQLRVVGGSHDPQA
ncbi:sigma-70 family RNA polymerase sigma factor [Pseudoroseomonas wenyumeiae]|uniref:Sigma-70 family RNA polymerase sigma factor n=2 Tax=Teichococcus wenyumeiae TaxID=2478470 RepID=A0A3A9J3K1_9PROT|nr:sigma-70 family RNA polymerase sigma factor [Pseudoroseomonas wenyumeiae]RMI25288.1 sigma-70 family RNA polymerase sigma factor [Pseudoroseomonas wenyumeiae]